MMKPVICKFEYRDDVDGDINKVKVYEKRVEIPEQCPIAFYSINQFSYHVSWEEKKALAARIEELEKFVSALATDLAYPTRRTSQYLDNALYVASELISTLPRPK